MSSAALALERVPAVRRRMAAAWAIAAAFGLAAAATAQWAATTLPHESALEELAYYPSGRHLVPAALGHGESAADLAWLRAVQYYGEHRATDGRFDQMAHVFDILTTLAPRFESAYVFGAFALAQEGNRFDQAVALLEKGVAANPSSARLAFELGFLHYVHPGHRDLPEAAEWFERASRLPNAPPNARRFAAFCRQNSGDLVLAYVLWEDVARTSGNRYLREMARREMERVQAAIETGRKDLAVHRLTVPRVIVKGRIVSDPAAPPPALARASRSRKR